MNKLFFPCIAAAVATAISQAAPSDEVSAAAKKLAEAANYSWTSTTENAGGGGGGGRGGFNLGPVSGMTEKDGFTVTTRSFNGNTSQTVRKGDQFATQGQDGNWMNAEEMRAQFGARGGGGGGGGGGARGGGGGGGGAGARGGRGGGGFGFGGGGPNPADELATLVGQVKNLKSADGAIMGDLSDEAVTQRLSFGGFGRGGGGGGQTPPAPKNASGTVKFWLKDGAVSKYQLHVKGTVAGRNGDMERDTTTTVELKDIGSTKITVPDAAKAKLGA